MNATRQKLVRDLVAAKRCMDAAEKEHEKARNAYRLAESLYLKDWPLPGVAPSPVFCDPFVITPTRYWQANDGDPRLEFTEADRCPTSE